MRMKILTVLVLTLLVAGALVFRIQRENTQEAAALAPLTSSLADHQGVLNIAQIIEHQGQYIAILREDYPTKDQIFMGFCRELKWSPLKGWRLVGDLGPHVFWQKDLSPNIITFNQPFPRSGDMVGYPIPRSPANTITFGFSESPRAATARLHFQDQVLETEVVNGSFIFVYPLGKIFSVLEVLDSQGSIVETGFSEGRQ